MIPIEVSAALVFRQGRLLITRRLPHEHLGGLWEFPGGKRERGESWESCLARELREELAFEIDVGRLLREVNHAYPEKVVRIRFFRCRVRSGEPKPIGCAELAWIHPPQLSQYDFPPANAVLLEDLARHLDWWQDPPPPGARPGKPIAER